MTDNRGNEASLKLKTARTLKWNTIDRLASQVLYGVVGVVLANVLSQEDFGLVGALLVFQAFAIIFADSGFGAALLQQKNPTEEDYSTVFWFNLVVSVAIYILLWFGAPLIADIFQGDRRLIPLSKAMFLTFVLNALAIVQINRLMKRMDVKMIAVSNLAGQVAGGGAGIALALFGYGAWALVWQSVIMAGVKTGILWATGGWRPMWIWSRDSFRKIWRIGFSVFSSTMLNTIFLNIYSFVIGAAYSLRSLGVYTQADKWSKMGSASLSQVLTASFVPVLSRVQDNAEDFRRYVRKINRFTGFIVFPAMIGLAAVGSNLFHSLFGEKWDAAIILFQILVIRGIFVVLVSLYSNYMLAKGYGKRLFMIEIIKDGAIAVAILATIFEGSVDLLVWGQLWASVAAWIVIVVMTSRAIGYSLRGMVGDLVPFLGAALLMWSACYGVETLWEQCRERVTGVVEVSSEGNASAAEVMISDTDGATDASGGSASVAEGTVAEVASTGRASAAEAAVAEVASTGRTSVAETKGVHVSEVGGAEVISSGRTSVVEAEGVHVSEMGSGEVIFTGSTSVAEAEGVHVSEMEGAEAYKADDASTVEIRGVEVAKTVDSPIAKIRGTIVGIDMRIVSGLIMILQVIVGGGCYLLIAKLCHFPELYEATNYIFGRFRKRA